MSQKWEKAGVYITKESLLSQWHPLELCGVFLGSVKKPRIIKKKKKKKWLLETIE